MSNGLPAAGSGVEVYGILGTFVGADYLANGEVYFTIQCTGGNTHLIGQKCRSQGVEFQLLATTVAYVPSTACCWPGQIAAISNGPGNSRSACAALEAASNFQTELARRRIASARSF